MPDVAHQGAPALSISAAGTANARATVLSRFFSALRHRTPDDSSGASSEIARDADADGILAELERI